jgi:hypothetical protein
MNWTASPFSRGALAAALALIPGASFMTGCLEHTKARAVLCGMGLLKHLQPNVGRLTASRRVRSGFGDRGGALKGAAISIFCGIAILLAGCSGTFEDSSSGANGPTGAGGAAGAGTSGAGANGDDVEPSAGGAGGESPSGAGGAGGGAGGAGGGAGGAGGAGGSQQCSPCTAGAACGWPGFMGECQASTCVVWCPGASGCEPHQTANNTCSTSPCPGKECASN